MAEEKKRIGKYDILEGMPLPRIRQTARLEHVINKDRQAVHVVERSRLDLTDPANAVALRVLVEQFPKNAKTAEFVERAVAAKPDVAVFHEFQGRLLPAAGQTARARDAFEQALDL